MKWTDKQIGALRELCEKGTPNKDIATILQCNVSDVYAKRSQLGITILKVKEAKASSPRHHLADTPTLKPCPFCGGEAGIWENKAQGYFYACKSCHGMINVYAETKEKAIEAWNQRNINLDLETAYRENRIIVLPVPIGASVYVIYPEETDVDGSIMPAGVEETRLSGYINEDGREFYLTYDNLNSCDIPINGLYTSREEAEATLRDREER